MTPKVSTMDQLKNVNAALDAWEESVLMLKGDYCVLNNFKDMVVITDKNGIIRFANPSSYLVLGYEPQELIGKSVDILAKCELGHKERISQYLVSKEWNLLGIGRSVKAKNKTGFDVDTYLYVNELKGDGEPLFVGVLHKV